MSRIFKKKFPKNKCFSKKHLKQILCGISCIFTLVSFSYASPKYAGVFTAEIYDQRTIVHRAEIERWSEEETNQHLLQNLSSKKKKCLDEHTLKRLKSKVQECEVQTGRLKEKNVWEEVLNLVSKASTIGIHLPSTLGKIASITTAAITEAIGKVTLHQVYSEHERTLILNELHELRKEIEKLEYGLDHEPTSLIEQRYVLKKRYIQEESLKQGIEKALLDTRYDNVFAPTTLQFIEKALELPISVKRILDINNSFNSKQRLERRFNEDPFFNGFNEEVRNQLWQIIHQAAEDSIAEANVFSDRTLRKCYYFCGLPGCGKTLAAEKIADFLGVARYEPTIRAESELSQENFEGADRLRGNVHIGNLAHTLIARTAGDDVNSSISYKNAYLILNDFDRFLIGPDGKIISSMALKFLLNFLDPGTNSFYSPFFRCKIDISRLNIIITANKPLPEQDDQHCNVQALKSRLSGIIEFPEFNELKRVDILNDFTKGMADSYQLTEHLSFQFTRDFTIAVTYKHDSLRPYQLQYDLDPFPTIPLEQSPQSTMRDFKEQVNNKIGRFKLEVLYGNAKFFFDQAEKLNVTGHTEEALVLYQAAAINGHPDAAYALGRFYEPQDSSLALVWHKKAVSLGNILSAHYVVRQSIALVDSEKDMKDTVVEQKLLPAKSLLANIISRDLSSIKLLLPDLTQDFYDLGERFEKRLSAKNEAFDCYKLAARYGNINALEALYNLGEWFEKQSGISLQNDNALTCFEEAANLGHGRSRFKLGWLYWRNQDLSSATPWLELAAEQQEANACNMLGVFYHQGTWGVIQNLTYAKDLFKLAAKQGQVFAQHNLFLTSSPRPDITLSEQQFYLNSVINYVNPFLNHFNPLLDHYNFDVFYQKRFYEMNLNKNCYYGMHADLAALIGIAYTTGIGTTRDGTLARQWLGAASRMGCWHIEPLLYSLYHPNKKPSSECILF